MNDDAEKARKIALQGIAEADFEIARQREKRAFHKGQLDILDRIASAKGSAPERRTRQFGPKTRKNAIKWRLLGHLQNAPGVAFGENDLAQALGGSAKTVRSYLWEFHRAGLVEFDGELARLIAL